MWGSVRPRPVGGELNSAIATAVVRVHTRYAGRGPTKAQAFHRSNFVVLLLQDSMTRGERTLADGGRAETAWLVRRQLQWAMREPLIGVIEELTGCRVVAFMGDNHIDPDIVINLFVLDQSVPAASAEAS
jgi:uncharacterized protein YbcI